MAVKDLKVGTRMSIGFALILVLMLSTMLVTFWSLSKVDESTQLVIEESLPFSLAADRMVLDVSRVNQWVTDASLTKNNDGLKVAEESAKAFRDDLNLFRGMFRDENDTQGLRQVDELEAAFEEMYATGMRMAAAYNESFEAGNLVMEELDADSAMTAKLVAALQESQVKEINDNGQMILAASQQVKTLQIDYRHCRTGDRCSGHYFYYA